jgi:hypothetical protein
VLKEFRDGEREVPEYLANMMATFKTHTMTYEDAILLAHKKLLIDHINAGQQRAINSHFKESR